MQASPASISRAGRGQNAFELLGLGALSTTDEIRQALSKHRVLLSMSAEEPHANVGNGKEANAAAKVEAGERLLADPVFRLREAASWYFSGISPSEPHDEVARTWQNLRDAAQNGEVEGHTWAHVWNQTRDLINDPAAWHPLTLLGEQLRDARVTSTAVESAVVEAVASWCSSAIEEVAASAPDRLPEVASIVTTPISEDVDDRLRERILSDATRHLSDVSSSYENQIDELAKGVEADSSRGGELLTLGEQLASKAQPWASLVDAFDDDPEIGEDARVRDATAMLLRQVCVAIYNHTGGLDDRALELAKRAPNVAETGDRKAFLTADVRLLSFQIATSKAYQAAENEDFAAAAKHIAEARESVVSNEQRKRLEELSGVIEQRRHIVSLRMTPITHAPGLRTIDGIGTTLYGSSDYDRETDSYVSTHYFTLLGIPVFPLARYRVRKLSGKTFQFLGKVPLRSGDIWHRWIALMIGGLIAISFITSGGSNASTLQTPSSSAAVARADLATRRIALQSQSAELDQLASQIASFKSQLTEIEAEYPNGAPSNVVSQYEAMRARANALVDEYDSKLSSYRSALAAFNADVDAYNARYGLQ